MAGYKTFGAEVLLAADVNEYLMRQAVIRVANSAALDAIASPEPGMLAYREDTEVTYRHNGAAWVAWLWDTGWINITSFESGFAAGGPTPRGRIKDGRLSFEGRITGTMPTSIADIAAIPDPLIPAVSHVVCASGNTAAATNRLVFNAATGTIQTACNVAGATYVDITASWHEEG